MDKGSLGTIILIVAIIVGIIAEMAFRQVTESLRNEGVKINVYDHFSYLFKYRRVINKGFLQDEEIKSTYRLYLNTSVILMTVLILGLINIMTDSLLFTQ